jgi:hypothetical protein
MSSARPRGEASSKTAAGRFPKGVITIDPGAAVRYNHGVVPGRSSWKPVVDFGRGDAALAVGGGTRRNRTREVRASRTRMRLGANDRLWASTTRPLSSVAEAFKNCRGLFGVMLRVGPVHPVFGGGVDQSAARCGEAFSAELRIGAGSGRFATNADEGAG